MSDADDLAAWADDRDHGAFSALVARYAALVVRCCRRYLGNGEAAEEAAQAVFILLSRKTPRDASRLGAWLYGAARRICREQQRALARRKHHEAEAAMQSATHLDRNTDDPVWTEANRMLDAAIEALSQPQRAVVIGCYLEGRAQSDVAEQLGVSEGAVKQRLHYALGKMREWFGRRGVAISSVALLAGLKSESLAIEPISIAACTRAALHPTTAPSATSLAGKAMTAMAMKTALISSIVLVAAAGIAVAASVAQDSKLVKKAAVVYPTWRTGGKPIYSVHDIPVTGNKNIGMWIDYSGMALWDYDGQVRGYFLSPGGHAITNDNSVCVVDFMQNSLVFAIDWGPSATETQAQGQVSPAAHLSDGQPASGHNYYNTATMERLGYCVRTICSAFTYVSGNTDFGATDTYNAVKKQYILPPAKGLASVATLPGVPVDRNSATLKNRANGDVHYLNGSQWGVYDGKTGALTNRGPIPGDPVTIPIAAYGGFIDDGRNRQVSVSAGGGKLRWVFRDLTSGTVTYSPWWNPDPANPSDHRMVTEIGNSFGLDQDTDGNLYGLITFSAGRCTLWTIDPETCLVTYRYTSTKDEGAGPYTRFFFSRLLHCWIYVARNGVEFLPTTLVK